MTVGIAWGFGDHERPQVAELYWQAFGSKFGRILGPPARAKRFLAAVMRPDCALVARAPDGSILGLAGIKTEAGALVDADFADIQEAYGALGGLWRVGLLQILDRKVRSGVFQMDGLMVASEARGQGIGRALLERLLDHARETGAERVELDVIDTNPRARALYERMGFEAQSESHLGPLRFVFGFRSALRMARPL